MTDKMCPRVLTTAMLAYTSLVSAFTSSIFSTATMSVSKQYHVSLEVTTLGVSLYVLGFGKVAHMKIHGKRS